MKKAGNEGCLDLTTMELMQHISHKVIQRGTVNQNEAPLLPLPLE